jgi:YHS domain-containing protein
VTGKTYYFNTKTREVSWAKPEGGDRGEGGEGGGGGDGVGGGAEGAGEGTSKGGGASDAWGLAKDPKTGKEYYFNSQTKQTSWTAPASMIGGGAGGGEGRARRHSAASVDAMGRLSDIEGRLGPLEIHVNVLDARFAAVALADDSALRGAALREVGDADAALAKMEAEKDQIFTGNLGTGQADAKTGRKAIQRRVDAAMAIVHALVERIKAAPRSPGSSSLSSSSSSSSASVNTPPMSCLSLAAAAVSGSGTSSGSGGGSGEGAGGDEGSRNKSTAGADTGADTGADRGANRGADKADEERRRRRRTSKSGKGGKEGKEGKERKERKERKTTTPRKSASSRRASSSSRTTSSSSRSSRHSSDVAGGDILGKGKST